MKALTRKAAVFALAVLAASVGLKALADEALPDGLKRFSGQVRGVVTAKGEANTIQFKVGRLLPVWKGSEAEKPELILGRTVTVGSQRKIVADGVVHFSEIHVAFLKKLEVGQELTLEIRNVEGDGFSILELTKEQREWAVSAKEEGGADRDLKARVNELEEEIARLKDENAELRRKLELLK